MRQDPRRLKQLARFAKIAPPPKIIGLAVWVVVRAFEAGACLLPPPTDKQRNENKLVASSGAASEMVQDMLAFLW